MRRKRTVGRGAYRRVVVMNFEKNRTALIGIDKKQGLSRACISSFKPPFVQLSNEKKARIPKRNPSVWAPVPEVIKPR